MTLDPRFLAARQMMQAGRTDGAVDMFATLVEEAIAKHLDSSLEAAVCFYEYGNALFRNVMNSHMEDDEEQEAAAAVSAAASLIPASDIKAAAAAAAEARLQLSSVQSAAAADDGDSKPAAKITAPSAPPVDDDDDGKEEKKGDDKQPSNTNDATTAAVAAVLDDEDIPLALEMMENAYAILEEKASLRCNKNNEWMQRQMPRVLQGLGDVLRELNRMADAADAYSRALPYREEFVQIAAGASSNENTTNATASSSLSTTASLQQLEDRRLLVEANVLVAEALLGCAHGHHVVTSETNDMLVTADERVDYARGYYDKARDELQETVYLLGAMAAQGSVDLGNEKENVCLAATLLMGVGETLAAFDEETTNDNDNNGKDKDVSVETGEPPAAKKARRT
eukprot:CAMPEP_0119016176 /NCGR_PEP_ID=MMETSP1176-20130426/11854_1 /TAXON_ID=265551 /ORGANISM="Synedropsis recta cf, Strain CCMP1620" /LENGTH=396 /DNA_ID=CAMNT_0006969509 /DNA_START=231 /DNA_END=1421 /DNA_ORIENTATION=-